MWAGLLIGLGLVLIIRKLSINTKLLLTTYEVVADIALFILINWIHGGTGEGVVHAAIASAVVGLYTAYLRRRIGYWNKDEYVPGTHNVEDQIK